jgi:D-sedoheptulose 7-phosphate isomerase
MTDIYVRDYFYNVGSLAIELAKEQGKLLRMVGILKRVRSTSGRVFVLGVGGSAANASHMVNDLRKLCNIEAYAPTDNVSELTARTNDEGWQNTFDSWLETSRLNQADAIIVLSVGGGNAVKNISPNIVDAVVYANAKGASIMSIVGKPDGYAAHNSTECLVLPIEDGHLMTPLAESFQSVICHLLVSHPGLQVRKTTW